ncbi:unnamed protein product [Nyctereutes procyonoides]|uniref:(raccoon dog) hypothetical protein n=1 Tax=Nyctereutes procyonoides TaxID=34880 RepID=A0A811XWG8_NYCPR|nr:unnamed protein product [Nyctereutes procyonoides]
MPKSKDFVSSSSSGSDSDVTPEKPVKKQKTGETSRALSSSKQSSSNRDLKGQISDIDDAVRKL